jgi:hypothetical protein
MKKPSKRSLGELLVVLAAFVTIVVGVIQTSGYVIQVFTDGHWLARVTCGLLAILVAFLFLHWATPRVGAFIRDVFDWVPESYIVKEAHSTFTLLTSDGSEARLHKRQTILILADGCVIRDLIGARGDAGNGIEVISYSLGGAKGEYLWDWNGGQREFRHSPQEQFQKGEVVQRSIELLFRGAFTDDNEHVNIDVREDTRLLVVEVLIPASRPPTSAAVLHFPRFEYAKGAAIEPDKYEVFDGRDPDGAWRKVDGRDHWALRFSVKKPKRGARYRITWEWKPQQAERAEN